MGRKIYFTVYLYTGKYVFYFSMLPSNQACLSNNLDLCLETILLGESFDLFLCARLRHSNPSAFIRLRAAVVSIGSCLLAHSMEVLDLGLGIEGGVALKLIDVILSSQALNLTNYYTCYFFLIRPINSESTVNV